MKIVSMSYTNTPGFSDPLVWLKRIVFYTGILEELARHHEVHSIEQIDHEGLLLKNKVMYHFLNFKKAKLYFPLKLHAYIKNLQPDVVLVNGLIFPWQVFQLRLKLGSSVKIILLHRGEKPYQGLRRWFQRLADRCIDAYLFASTGFTEQWVIGGNIGSKRKIYEVMQASSVFHPQNRSAARMALGVDGEPAFLWVGRLDANKDPLTVVNAFMRFADLHPTAKLYMIYQTEELLTDIKKLLQSRAAASSKLILLGKLAHNELEAWYNAADFIVSGSHHEGSGIGVCEAMSCGCIPVVTDISSFRAMTKQGSYGLLYEPGNMQALVKSLLQATTMNITSQRERVLQHFKAELSFEAVGRKIEQVIESLKN